MSNEEIGKLAYATYTKTVGGKTWDGRDCPKWEGLTDTIRLAWCNAASVVYEYCDAEVRAAIV